MFDVSLIYNPFKSLKGAYGMAAAVVVIMLSTLVGWYSGIHYDGIIDAHVPIGGAPPSLVIVFVESIINWVVAALLFFVIGLLLVMLTGGERKFNLLDYFAAFGFARYPMMIIAAVGGYLANGGYLDSIRVTGNTVNMDISELVNPVVIAAGIIMLIVFVWTLITHFFAFMECGGLRAGHTVIGLTAGIIIGEILSKMAITAIIPALLSAGI